MPIPDPKWITEGKTIYCGIDPGQKGGIGVIYPNGRVGAWQTPVTVEKRPIGKNPQTGKKRIKQITHYNEPGMVKILARFASMQKAGYKVVVVLEEVSAMGAEKHGRRQGVTSSFKFGVGFGLWRGIISALGLPYVLIRPAVWKPVMVGVGADKEVSRQTAIKMFDIDLPLKKDADRAEALLIAEFKRRKDGGKKMPVEKKPRVRKVSIDVDRKKPSRNKKAKPKKPRKSQPSGFWQAFGGGD